MPEDDVLNRPINETNLQCITEVARDVSFGSLRPNKSITYQYYILPVMSTQFTCDVLKQIVTGFSEMKEECL